MPLTKNRRKKRKMKPRTFQTAKAARRYLNRFRWQFRISGRYHRSIVDTVIAAMRRLKPTKN